jgi:hypothetical protein
VRFAPVSSAAKTPGFPLVSACAALWKPASFKSWIISAHPSFVPRFSAAIEGTRIQSSRRLTDSSWRRPISA